MSISTNHSHTARGWISTQSDVIYMRCMTRAATLTVGSVAASEAAAAAQIGRQSKGRGGGRLALRVPTRVLPIRTQRWGPGVAGRTRRSAPGATGRAARAPSLPGGVDTRSAAAASGRRRRKCAAVAAASGRPRRKCAAHDARPRPLSPASPPRGRRSGCFRNRRPGAFARYSKCSMSRENFRDLSPNNNKNG